MEMKFEHNSFHKRLSSMLAVDFRRMFTMRMFYIIAGTCLVIPILILVMTTMVGGGDTSMGFENTWQIIGSLSGGNPMAMGMTDMCNINLLYFFAAVLVGLFVSDDFKSGYAKNLFTVRAKKSDYVISKTLVTFVGGALMLLCFFVGSVLGGAIAGLSFDSGAAGISGIVMCMLSKVSLMAVFVPIYLLMSVAAKQRTWMSIIGSFCVGMLLFMMIPALTPLDATMMNVILCLAGGAMLSTGLGVVSNIVLKTTSLV